ncbi:hypothetical protein EVAR_40220_1 [Eumeta japonica]|uniref:Uncharacterized protein n=1 Tax=Eumeta variegata TaxID=151549 RepID=A0A4C1X7R4_EUMVA|nr:hypothetical protein EVAR_40220_1 [Eumeta japonica]
MLSRNLTNVVTVPVTAAVNNPRLARSQCGGLKVKVFSPKLKDRERARLKGADTLLKIESDTMLFGSAVTIDLFVCWQKSRSDCRGRPSRPRYITPLATRPLQPMDTRISGGVISAFLGSWVGIEYLTEEGVGRWKEIVEW